MIFSTGFSQNTQTLTLTPNGVLDHVFDNSGNQYSFQNILINTQNSASNKVTLVGCSGNSIFNLYFEPGCGMDNTSSAIENARRAVVCQVFEDLSAFLTTNTSVLQPTSTTKVNIWVRNINNIPSVPNTLLGIP